ncbi:MAG: iron chelate uptake ABC transporter family permease subunit [Alphaproteobacteria bacterium]
MDEFILRALIGGVVLALVLGPLGCFVVWRHMAYFGDTIAHAALLGVALSLISGTIGLTPAIFIVALGVALALHFLGGDKRFHSDTILGILAHGTLALGVLLVALTRTVRVDITTYLFGDVLAISWDDVVALAVLAVLILLLLRAAWRPLLMVTLSPAIAHVEGVHVRRTQLMLVVMLAAIIAVAIKLVGVLLITALLIMPAASAR